MASNWATIPLESHRATVRVTQENIYLCLRRMRCEIGINQGFQLPCLAAGSLSRLVAYNSLMRFLQAVLRREIKYQ